MNFLTSENYYQATEYMSVSQYKDFCQCEAMAMAKINGTYTEEETTAMLVGGYVDAWFEGTLDEFKEKHPEIFKRDGELRADYAQADQIIKRVQQDKLFMEYMGGEKQVIETAELFGTQWKIKIDSLCPDKIVDLKCMRTMDRVIGKSFVEYWRYDTQLAVYQRVHFENTGIMLPCYLAVCTKEKVTDIAIIEIPQWRLNECIEEVERDMPRILEVKGGLVEPEPCGVCDYCKSVKVLTKPIDFELVGFDNREIKRILGE